MPEVLISYSRENAELVEALAADIRELGHEVWFDRELTGGQAWWDRILDRVRGCGAFVFVLTPEGLASVACQREFTYAAAVGKPILPVLMTDGVSENLLPPELAAIQYVDYRQQDKNAFASLNKALRHLPAPEPLPEPLPDPPPVPLSYLGGLASQIRHAERLSRKDQASIVLDLKSALGDPATAGDALELLKGLQSRRDLLVATNKEIEEILAGAAGVATRAGGARSPTVESRLGQLARQPTVWTAAGGAVLILVLVLVLDPWVWRAAPTHRELDEATVPAAPPDAGRQRLSATSIRQVVVQGEKVYFVKSDGTVWRDSLEGGSASRLEGLGRVRQVIAQEVAGRSGLFLLLEDGKIKTYRDEEGHSEEPTLYDPGGQTPQILATEDYLYVLKEYGEVWRRNIDRGEWRDPIVKALDVPFVKFLVDERRLYLLDEHGTVWHAPAEGGRPRRLPDQDFAQPVRDMVMDTLGRDVVLYLLLGNGQVWTYKAQDGSAWTEPALFDATTQPTRQILAAGGCLYVLKKNGTFWRGFYPESSTLMELLLPAALWKFTEILTVAVRDESRVVYLQSDLGELYRGEDRNDLPRDGLKVEPVLLPDPGM